MKYCINFNKEYHILNEVDEISIIYNSQDTSLINFLQEHKNQRIHLAIEENFNNAELLAAIHKAYPEINFVLKIPNNKELINKCKEVNLPFWIRSYINNWDTLTYFLSLGVTDVLITEELGFDIERVAAAAHKCGTKVRIFPNVAQSSINEMYSIKKFFVRPEDIQYYEPYVDVCEFFGTSKNIETYYKVYTKDKKWFGQLKEIIISFNDNLDNRCLLNNFAQARINCDKKCLKGSKCQLCEKFSHLNQTLSDRNIIVKSTN